MRILLIAPTHSDLPNIDAEIAAISSFHEVERVTGIVRDADILRAIDKGDYDVLWIASHGSGAGIMLSNTVLSPEGVGQYVSTSGVKLCVMNTCASEDVANRIIAGGDADMVFTISETVKDDDALRFGSLFAGELAKTDDFEGAFTVAAGPAPEKYRYLKAKQALRGMAMSAASALDKLEEKVEALSRIVFEGGINAKNANERFEGVRIQFEGMRVQFDSTRVQFDSMRTQLEAIRAHIATVATPVNAAPVAIPATILAAKQSPSYSPTFYLLLALIVLALLASVFWLGGR